jgi:phage recombination protein Bet
MSNEERGLVEYQAKDGQKIKLTPAIVKKYLVSGRSEYVTDQELYIYMGLCKSRGMNPFIRDCHLVKYVPSDPAAIITSIDYYRKRARSKADCRGWKTGIVVLKDGQLVYREGAIVLDGEKLVGGWCEAQPEGWSFPMRKEVNLKRYIKKTKDGAVTRFWAEENQPEMIAKVAESQLLRSLWPDEFQGLYVDSEMESHDAQATFNEAVSTPSAPGDTPAAEAEATFEQVFAAEIKDPLWSAFFRASCENYALTEENARAEFVQQPDMIRKIWVDWKRKAEMAKTRPITAQAQAQQPQAVLKTPPPPQPEPEQPKGFRDEWINLRQKGYSTFVFRNKERFAAADAELQAEAKAKWESFYPDNPWPLDPKPETAPPQTHGEAQGEAIAPQAIPTHPAHDEMRIKVIRECQSYGQEVCQRAKKALGMSESDATWPPTASGVSRLLDECIRIEEEDRRAGR